MCHLPVANRLRSMSLADYGTFHDSLLIFLLEKKNKNKNKTKITFRNEILFILFIHFMRLSHCIL